MERIAQLDEEYAKKVDEILEGDTDKVPMRVQISLTMAMQSQILRALNRVNASVNQVMDKQDIANGRTGKLECEIIELKKKNTKECKTNLSAVGSCVLLGCQQNY
jgi:hypothetical protein